MRRIIIHLISIGFIMFSLIANMLNSDISLLAFYIPNFLVLLGNIIFLSLSLKNKPKKTNDSLFMFVIVLITGNFSIIDSFFGEYFPIGKTSMLIRAIGAFISLFVSVLTLIGLITLGKQFTVLPEANKLKTTGIYSFSRHPIYVSYFINYILHILIFQTYMSILFAIIQILLQLYRARAEERVLSSIFPEYSDYKKKVMFLGRRKVKKCQN